MFKNIFLKSIYEKRWSTFGWAIAIVSMTMFVVLLFPTLRDAIGDSLNEVPESMKAFMGDANTYQTLWGYVDIQVTAQMIFLTIIMAVIFGSGLLAGDEGDGTLQSLLAQPVKRRTVYIQKYLALAFLTFVITFLTFVSVYISALIINESMDWWRLAQSTFSMWLITFVFGVAAYALGAFTGKRGLSGSLVGMMAFIMYMVTSLAVGIKSLRLIDNLSPFHYFNTPSVIVYGLDLGNVAVLVGIIIALSIAGYARFVRRDIG